MYAIGNDTYSLALIRCLVHSVCVGVGVHVCACACLCPACMHSRPSDDTAKSMAASKVKCNLRLIRMPITENNEGIYYSLLCANMHSLQAHVYHVLRMCLRNDIQSMLSEGIYTSYDRMFVKGGWVAAAQTCS